MSRRGSVAIAVAAVTAAVALATALVYMVRASGPLGSNWPVTYNLTSSDNGVLYQLAHDLFSGVPLDWSFSPQTYTFPEIPISLLAYLLAFGNLYWYYLLVAVINTALLCVVLFVLVRYLFPAAGLRQHLLRTVIATAPLVLLPLLAHNTLYLFAVAPTYYFGMYMFAFALPIALLTPHRWLRIVVLVGYTLTGASDPLLLAMTLPGIVVVAAVARWQLGRWRPGLRILAVSAGVLVVAEGLRLTVLNPMIAADPMSYISFDKAIARDVQIVQVLMGCFVAGVDLPLLLLSFAALAACVWMLVRALREVRRDSRAERGRTVAEHPDPEQPAPAAGHLGLTAQQSRPLARVYLSTLPFLGAIAMFAIQAVHIYYLWLLLVGALVVAALLLPTPRVVQPLAIGLAAVLVVAGMVLTTRNLLTPTSVQYFGYQDSVTQCIDANVPANALGYATFSDARHYGLTSAAGVRLLPANGDLGPSFWLANRYPSQHSSGSFALVGPSLDEAGLGIDALDSTFGAPERTVTCPNGFSLWFYQSATAQQHIAAYIDQWAWLR